MIFTLALIGLVLSVYSIYVSRKLNKNYYKPFCDVSKDMSCTKAFSSKYSRFLLIHNSTYGVLYYLIIMIISLQGYYGTIFYLAILSTIFSIYLAYVSYFKMKNFCLVCNAIYLINILILIFSYLQI